MKHKSKRILTASLSVILLTACPWARGATALDEFLLYQDRIVGYTDSGVDITIALYDDGKITNATAQVWNKAFKRLHTANEKIFRAVVAARTASSLTLTGTTRALIESELSKIRSDITALTPSSEVIGGASARVNEYLPFLAEAVQGFQLALNKLKLSGTGMGLKAEVALSAAQNTKLSNLAERLQVVGREVAAWNF